MLKYTAHKGTRYDGNNIRKKKMGFSYEENILRYMKIKYFIYK